MTRSMLDVIVDRLIGGEPVTMTFLTVVGACDYPDHSPLTAYRSGCRCPRCRTVHNTNSRNWQRLHRARLRAARRWSS